MTVALRELGYDGDIWGMVGKESREAGVRAVWNGEKLQLLGISEVLSSIPFLHRLLGEITKNILAAGPECVVIADSPDFNLRLAHRLRSRGYGGRICFISPPTVWAWRRGRVKKIAALVDECFPLFEFEHDFLVKNGCGSFWTGHPMLEELSDASCAAENVPSGLWNDGRTVAFLPGSRGVEIKNLMPLMENVADYLAKKGWRPVFSVAQGLREEVRNGLISRLRNRSFDFYTGRGRDLIAASACSVAASGTVATESLMLGRYMVVVYRLSSFSAFLARRLVRVPSYTIPNILLGEELYPEFMQEQATVENVSAAAERYLNADAAEKGRVENMLCAAKAMLGRSGAYKAWSERILEAC